MPSHGIPRQRRGHGSPPRSFRGLRVSGASTSLPTCLVSSIWANRENTSSRSSSTRVVIARSATGISSEGACGCRSSRFTSRSAPPSPSSISAPHPDSRRWQHGPTGPPPGTVTRRSPSPVQPGTGAMPDSTGGPGSMATGTPRCSSPNAGPSMDMEKALPCGSAPRPRSPSTRRAWSRRLANWGSSWPRAEGTTARG